MGIWIRTQDKETITNCIGVGIGLEDDKSSIYGNGYILLGKYSTKEKALKVLDAIQKHICLKDKLQQEYGVIQMPQDDEVLGE